MTVSKLATRSSGNAGQYSSRGGRKIDRFLVHHAATSNLDVVLSMMRTGSREVSSNYVISNTGEIISVVPEEYRAWTSASPAWDGRAITVEVINSKTGDPWPISAKAQEALSRLIADVATRYKFTPKRDGRNSTVIGHRELYTWFGESYATACPGGINLAAVTSRAAGIINNPEQPTVQVEEEDDDMKPTVHVRTDGNTEWTRAQPEIGKDLSKGKSRKDGKVTVFRGYEVTTDSKIGTAWARMHAGGSGNETSRTKRADYIAIQQQAERLSLHMFG